MHMRMSSCACKDPYVGQYRAMWAGAGLFASVLVFCGVLEMEPSASHLLGKCFAAPASFTVLLF